MKYVYQYVAPDDPNEELGDPVRWIAADTEEEADRCAARLGWKPDGGLILGEEGYPDDTNFKALGCDQVVISIPVWGHIGFTREATFGLDPAPQRDPGTALVDGDYRLAEGGIWLTMGPYSARLTFQDGCARCVVFPYGQEMGKPLAEWAVRQSEAERALEPR